MSNQQSANQHPRGPGVGAAAPPPPAPGPGARTLSAKIVQDLVDRAGHFNMFSMPDSHASDPAIRAPGASNSVIGMRIHEVLHRFAIITQPPTAQMPLRARNLVGEPAGTFTHRWLMMPDDFVAAPGREPPPTPLDTARAQRFVMLDSRCAFGDGRDGFRGFGTGQTLPTTVNGQSQLLATAVGTILEGFGKFEGHEEGTYVYCGTLSPQRGFTGNVLLRVIDRQDTFHTEHALPTLDARANPEPEVVYIIFRGQAVPADPVTPNLGPEGRPIGLTVEQGIRLLDLDFKSSGHRGLQSTAQVGQLIGRITAHVTFNPAAPGGTAADPIPFTSYDEFVFVDREGQPIGTFTANSSEGRVFNTQFSGQPGIRFGGVGKILSSTGPFEGMQGLMTDNSVVFFIPHVSASVYVLRILDPHGKFRAHSTRA
jgi:hypothetical protein